MKTGGIPTLAKRQANPVCCGEYFSGYIVLSSII